VSASVNLPLHHKVQKFSSGTGSPGWSRKGAVKRLCVHRMKLLVISAIREFSPFCSAAACTFEPMCASLALVDGC